jgi:hypothetical protein
VWRNSKKGERCRRLKERRQFKAITGQTPSEHTSGERTEVVRAMVVGPIRVQQPLPCVSQGAERSHPQRLVSISYVKTLDCHGRGRAFEPRRPAVS